MKLTPLQRKTLPDRLLGMARVLDNIRLEANKFLNEKLTLERMIKETEKIYLS